MTRCINYFFVVCACLLLPSCMYVEPEKSVATEPKNWEEVVAADSEEFLLKEKHRPKMIDAFSLQEKEAKLIDVPVPFGVEPLESEQAISDKLVLSYQTSLSQKELIKFYQTEMERLGWRQSATFCAHESLLQFDKPQRLCSVSIHRKHAKHKKNANRLTVFIGPRTA